MLTGFLLIAGIILFGIFTIVSLVFAIIYLAGGKNSRFTWLILFFASLLMLLACIYFTVTKVVNKAKQVGEGLENMAKEMTVNELMKDSLAMSDYNYADTTFNEQFQYLKSIEPEKSKGNIPTDFYRYLGFRDYYRLPLCYPYSLHCIDVLDNGTLYDEEHVRRFDENNNGEKSCNLENIHEFAFDGSILFARHVVTTERKQEERYSIYFFKTGKTESFTTRTQAFNRADALGFKKAYTLKSCSEYYNSFF